MLMERVGRSTVRHPWITIAAVLLITAGSLLTMYLRPMETSFETEDFLPDMEISRTNTKYSETFTSSYNFLILLKAEEDIVTPEAFMEMLNLSQDFHESSVYQEWKDPGTAVNGPSSPAGAMYDMYISYTKAQDILDLGSVLSGELEVTGPLREDIAGFREELADTAWENGTGNISQLTGGMKDPLSDFNERDPVPVYEQMNISAEEYYASFRDRDEMKEEISILFSFSFSSPEMEEAQNDMRNYSQEAAQLLREVQRTIAELDDTLENRTLDPSAEENLETVRKYLLTVTQRVNGLLGVVSEEGNPSEIVQSTKSFFGGRYMMSNFLTDEFDPSSGSFSAGGAIMVAPLDNIIYDMYEEDMDEVLEIEKALLDIVEENDEASRLSIRALPNAVVNEKITEASNESMRILLPLAMLFVFVILLLIYRSFFDMVLNLVALVFAIIWMYGFGSLMGYSSNPMITAVPVLLVGLGIDYGIHLTMRYREEIRKGKKVSEAIMGMSASVGMALLLATFTTVFAFLSNIASPVKLIMQFGVMAAVGILSSFMIMMFFVPSVKRLMDVRRARKGKALFRGIKEGQCDLCESEKASRRWTNRAILFLTLKAEKHPITILFVVGLLTAGMFAAAMNSEVTFDVNDFLPEDLQESKDLNYIMENFALAGSGETGIILVEGDIADPEVLEAMDRSMNITVNNGSGYILIEGERPKASFILYAMEDTYYQNFISEPDSPFVQEYPMYFNLSTGLPQEGVEKEQVDKVMDAFYDGYPSTASTVVHRENGTFTMAAIAFTIDTEDDSEAWELYDDLRRIDDPIEEMEGRGVEDVSVTGSSILMAAIVRSINESQITSLILTMVVSFIVLTIIFFIEERSLVLGGVAVLPVAFCVIWIVGTMYIVGIPLNVMTITIGALTVGLGITYGIHITHRFVEDIGTEDDLTEASKKTIINTGSALFGAALTTVAGFGLLSFATMPPLQQFGRVTALAIIYSFISSIIVLPVLLILWAKSRRRYRERKKTAN
ncbi:MAG: MMPL family transporter [Thermoplasmatota archaeon]